MSALDERDEIFLQRMTEIMSDMMDKKLSAYQADMDKRFTSFTANVNDRFVELSASLDKKFDKFSHTFDSKLERELRPIRADISMLKEDVSTLKKDMVEVKSDIADLEGKISKTNIELHDLRGIIENRVEKNIQLLSEGYTGSAKSFEVYRGYMDDLREDMSLVKEAVAGNIGAFKQGAT